MNDYSFNLHRIFVGDLPLAFYGEIALRTAVMFAFTLVLIRTMGKRSLGQLSAFDFVIIIALGSAVGDPMFYVDVPLLYGMLVVAAVVLMERLLGVLAARHRRVEQFVDSTAVIVVRDGCIDRDALRRELMSINELHQMLRGEGVEQMSDVALAVLEPSGKLSIRTVGGSEYVSDLWMLEPLDTSIVSG